MVQKFKVVVVAKFVIGVVSSPKHRGQCILLSIKQRACFGPKDIYVDSRGFSIFWGNLTNVLDSVN